MLDRHSELAYPICAAVNKGLAEGTSPATRCHPALEHLTQGERADDIAGSTNQVCLGPMTQQLSVRVSFTIGPSGLQLMRS